MRHLFILFVLSLITLASSAQQLVVKRNSIRGAVMQLSTPMPTTTTTQFLGLTYSMLSLPSASHTNNVGLPQLPCFSRIIEIPVCGNIKLSASTADSITVSVADLGISHPLLPSQPHRRRTDTTPLTLFIDHAAYDADTTLCAGIANIEILGIARSHRLARLTIYPVAYNPQRQQLTVRRKIDIQIDYINADDKATAALAQQASPVLPAPSHFIPLTKPSKRLQSQAPLRYLIVAHSMFRGQLDEFIAWKRRQGFITDIAYTDDPEVGTSNSDIAAYIRRQYTNASAALPAPSYLLLVGDHEQISAFSSRTGHYEIGTNHITDLYFAEWTDDFIPDCLYGRLSATNADELQAQISKILLYEQYAFADDSYLQRATVIAGVDDEFSSRYCNPAMDYAAARYYTNANGFSNLSYYRYNNNSFPPSITITGLSTNNAAAGELQSLYNEGQGIINYSGHGLANGWSNPSFKVNNAATMTNYGMPSIMIGNCCLSNHFNTDVCLGEALMRRSDNAGAVAYIGATNDTYWDDDFFWCVGFREFVYYDMFADGAVYDADHLGMYDRLFHTANEPFAERYTTMGAMIHAGNMAVSEDIEYAEYADYYWEIYNLLGDPSLSPWLGRPRQMTLDYQQPISRNAESIAVTTEPYAYVAITTADGSRVISAAFADADGHAVLSNDPTVADTIINIVASAQNRITAFGSIELSFDTNLQMSVTNLRINNAIAGDTVDFSFSLHNLSDNTLRNVNYTLRGNPLHIEPLRPNEYIDSIAPHTAAHIEHRCRSILASTIPDQSIVPLTMQFIADTIVSSCTIRMTVNAPRFSIKNHIVHGIVKPGNGLEIDLTLANIGHADAQNFSCAIRQPYDLAVATEPPIAVNILRQNETIEVHYRLTINSEAHLLRELPLQLVILQQGEEIQSIPLTIPIYSDDFESGDFSALNWQNSTSYPWVVIDTLSYHGDRCARSYPNLPNSSKSTLTLPFEAKNNDSVTFFYRTASERGIDKLIVSIDGNTLLTASGIDPQWHRAALPVAAGFHVITFTYSKDDAYATVDDCVWIDALFLPDTSSQTTIHTIDTICQGSEYSFYDQSINTDTTGYLHLSFTSNDTAYHTSLLILPHPSLHIVSSDTSVLPGQSTFITARGASTYLWNTGHTSATIEVAPTDTTTYTVIGFLASCTDTASITIGIRPLSIDGITSSAPSIYPNPTTSSVTIVADNLTAMTLTDLYGRTLITQTIHDSFDSHSLNLAHLPNGLYLLHLSSPAYTTIHKITKQ